MRNALVILIAMMASSVMAQAEGDAAAVKDITPLELSEQLGHVQVIDVNEADNYAFAHIPGAKLMAYDAISLDLLPADKSTALVFYCWSPECPAAAMAAGSAVGLGFTNVACLHAGITGWQDAGFPTEP